MKTVIDITQDRNEVVTITCTTSDLAGLGEVLHQYMRDVPNPDMTIFVQRLRSHTSFVSKTLTEPWFRYSKTAVYDDCHER